jgi:two-component system LytT family response regulator
MITALLVDDEPMALDRLADLLEGFESIDVIGRAGSVDEAERFLKGRVPDVVFLDITMPGRLGVDLLGSVPKGTKVVFVTARENYAVDAFRAGAVDYVLKPFDRDRLLITVERLEELFSDDGGSAASQPRAGEAGADVLRRTMAEWEALLSPAEFPRISRSLFVQLPKIRSTQWQSRDQMLVLFAGLDEPLPIGRTPMARLKELLAAR